MNHDRSLHNTASNQVLLAPDRRRDARRSCRAVVWRLDEDIARGEEFGVAVDISRGGLRIVPSEENRVRLDTLRPGREWLVILDDLTGMEPLADQRPALIRLLRVDAEAGGIRLACNFVMRKVGRCLPGRASGLRLEGDAISDVVAGDLLDELAQRVRRDVAATIRSGAY